MIHQYQLNGYNIVLDVNSGAIHVVDGLTYDMIAEYKEREKDELIADMAAKHGVSKEEAAEAYGEIGELEASGELFSEDDYEPYIDNFKKRPTVVKALCLHIAHDCNLACRYCFAGEGEYHGERALMSYEVGKQALDFLVANSGNRRNLEVDFFGGEPLLNFQVVKDLVAYGRSLEKEHDKHFRFTLTTNGVLLNDDVMDFVNREMDNVVLSIDGRKEVHNRMRPFRNGGGSYDLIVPKFQKLADSATMSVEPLPATTWISPRMCCIWRIWDSSRSRWSRWWLRRATTTHCGRRICRSSLRSTTGWRPRWCAATERRKILISSIS